MYCRNCGRKMEAGAVRCRKCGEPADTAEICGGFWGLIESNASNADKAENTQRSLVQEQTLSDREARISRLEKEQGDQKKRTRSWRNAFFVMTAAACVLAAALIGSSLFSGRNNSEPSEKPGDSPAAAVAEGDGGQELTEDESTADTGQTDAEAEPVSDSAGSGTAADTAAPAQSQGDTAEAAEQEPAGAEEGQTGAGTVAAPADSGLDSGSGTFSSVVRGRAEGGGFNGMKYTRSFTLQEALQKVVDERKIEGLSFNGTVKYKGEDNSEVPCGEGYSRIEYSTDSDDDGSGKIIWSRLLQKKENDKTVSAADRNHTVVITDQQTYDEGADTYTVIENCLNDSDARNVIEREGLPAYNQIRYTYSYFSDDNEYRLTSAEYLMAKDSGDGDPETAFAVDCEYEDINSFMGYDKCWQISCKFRGKEVAEKAGYDGLRIRYQYTGLPQPEDMYRVLELQYRRDGKAVTGPDGFAVMRCSYDESGGRTEEYYLDKNMEQPASVSSDLMLRWENSWLLYSEDFDLRFFRPGKTTEQPPETGYSYESSQED